MKTIRLGYHTGLEYCPQCRSVYFGEVDCLCENIKEDLSKTNKEKKQ